MQCHNTDVILSARFSNKLEPLLSLLWQYEEFTRRYLRSESETRGATTTTTQGRAFFCACGGNKPSVHHSPGGENTFVVFYSLKSRCWHEFSSRGAARRMWPSSEIYFNRKRSARSPLVCWLCGTVGVEQRRSEAATSSTSLLTLSVRLSSQNVDRTLRTSGDCGSSCMRPASF